MEEAKKKNPLIQLAEEAIADGQTGNKFNKKKEGEYLRSAFLDIMMDNFRLMDTWQEGLGRRERIEDIRREEAQ